MLAVFLVSLAAFICIILFLSWYYKKMISIMFGDMNAMLESVLEKGEAPRQWNKRQDRLNRALERYRDADKKWNGALAKHIKYVEASVKDMSAYAKKTSFIQDEAERSAALEKLERFRDETVRQYQDMTK